MLRFPFSIHPRAAQPSSAVNDQVFGSTSATPAGPRRVLSLPSPWDKCQNLGCGWAEAQTPPAAAFGDPGAHVTDAVIRRGDDIKATSQWNLHHFHSKDASKSRSA